MKDTAKPRGVDGDERSRQRHQAIREPCQSKRNTACKIGISEQMDREEQMEQEEPRGAIYIEPSVYAKEEVHTEPSEELQGQEEPSEELSEPYL